jgi:hypothetical protein
MFAHQIFDRSDLVVVRWGGGWRRGSWRRPRTTKQQRSAGRGGQEQATVGGHRRASRTILLDRLRGGYSWARPLTPESVVRAAWLTSTKQGGNHDNARHAHDGPREQHMACRRCPSLRPDRSGATCVRIPASPARPSARTSLIVQQTAPSRPRGTASKLHAARQLPGPPARRGRSTDRKAWSQASSRFAQPLRAGAPIASFVRAREMREVARGVVNDQ